MSKGGLVFPRWSECAPDPCWFDEVEVGDDIDDPSGLIKPGMKILLPCSNCGATPRQYMDWLDETIVELETALKANGEHKNIPLYHWSPANNRNGIVRRGLVPNRRPTTHSEELGGWRAPYTCFGTDPVWAWALSGNMGYTPDGEWDLWQTWWNFLEDPEVLANDEGDGIHEVRTRARVYKRNLKYLGTRIK